MNRLLVKFNRCPKRSNCGFSLLELAIVLAIVGLLFVFILPTTTTVLNNRKREQTQLRLKNIESAIANYVAINKRLPCPADGLLAVGNALAGVEDTRDPNFDCTIQQVRGVVPWVTIGLSHADILDGWDRRITYRAAFSLTRNAALDMSMCDSAGVAETTTTVAVSVYGACVSGCVGTNVAACTSIQKYLTGKGFDIRDGSGANLIMSSAISPPAPTQLYTGSAFVVISHGENGYGAYSNDGTYLANPTAGVAGDIEAFNINGPTARVTSALPTSANTFRNAEFSEGVAAVYFDDRILHPSLFSLIQRAQIGPRSH